MILAPPWAFSAGAIHGIDDTHLVKGIHIRAVPSPSAGLPATPLFVYRAVLTPDAVASLGQRTDVTWIDSHGVVLTAPFEVQPDNPVTGHIPGGLAIGPLVCPLCVGGLLSLRLAGVGEPAAA